jgi:hypothetical protein
MIEITKSTRDFKRDGADVLNPHSLDPDLVLFVPFLISLLRPTGRWQNKAESRQQASGSRKKRGPAWKTKPICM